MSVGGPPLAMLARPLHDDERASIGRRFASTLRSGAPCELPATAFVSLYERGRVIGCVGHADVRSALAAARVDPRFGGAREQDGATTAQLSLLVRGRVVSPSEVAAAVALGLEGMVAFDATGAIRAVLLPDVAPDMQRDGEAMAQALAQKAGVASLDALGKVMLVRRERFIVRPTRSHTSRATLPSLAARWLAARIDAQGAIAHGLDARAGRVHRSGPFHLGRAAVVLSALAAHGRQGAALRRGRAWLRTAIEEALDGGEGLPRAAAERAASLALAVRAGVDCQAPLEALARSSAAAIAEIPWHAAQIVAVLGERSPDAIRQAALAAIDQDAFAPWSTLAADALGDARRAKRGRARLARAVPASGPHPGGVRTRSAPEVALTALVVEVLAGAAVHRAAVRRAMGFLASQAYATARDVPPALDPMLALGAFPLAPHADFLRADVTAHALLALLAADPVNVSSR